jgi:hypothetical protein
MSCWDGSGGRFCVIPSAQSLGFDAKSLRPTRFHQNLKRIKLRRLRSALTAILTNGHAINWLQKIQTCRNRFFSDCLH